MGLSSESTLAYRDHLGIRVCFDVNCTSPVLPELSVLLSSLDLTATTGFTVSCWANASGLD